MKGFIYGTGKQSGVYKDPYILFGFNYINQYKDSIDYAEKLAKKIFNGL